MSAETAAQPIEDAMRQRGAVRHGAGARRFPAATVCGKTGSAETSDDKSVETNSWFCRLHSTTTRHPYVVSRSSIEQGGAGSRLATELGAQALKAAIALN